MQPLRALLNTCCYGFLGRKFAESFVQHCYNLTPKMLLFPLSLLPAAPKRDSLPPPFLFCAVWSAIEDLARHKPALHRQFAFPLFCCSCLKLSSPFSWAACNHFSWNSSPRISAEAAARRLPSSSSCQGCSMRPAPYSLVKNDCTLSTPSSIIYSPIVVPPLVLQSGTCRRSSQWFRLHAVVLE